MKLNNHMYIVTGMLPEMDSDFKVEDTLNDH